MKTLEMPDKIYDDLAKAFEELTFMAKKPISKSMAVNLLIEIYHAHLNNRCALDAFSQQLQNLDIMLLRNSINTGINPKAADQSQRLSQRAVANLTQNEK